MAGGKGLHLNIDRLSKRPSFFNFKEGVAKVSLPISMLDAPRQGGRYDYGVEPELENFLALGCEEWRCRLTDNRQLLRHRTLPHLHHSRVVALHYMTCLWSFYSVLVASGPRLSTTRSSSTSGALPGWTLRGPAFAGPSSAMSTGCSSPPPTGPPPRPPGSSPSPASPGLGHICS